jgi:hypothetical protein
MLIIGLLMVFAPRVIGTIAETKDKKKQLLLSVGGNEPNGKAKHTKTKSAEYNSTGSIGEPTSSSQNVVALSEELCQTNY